MQERYTHSTVNFYEMSIKVMFREGDRSDKFLSSQHTVCELTTATNFKIPRLTQMYPFPGQMN